MPAGPPVIDRAVLARYLSGFPRLLEQAADRERRELVRQFVEKVELDPATREVELQLRLPANRTNHMAAAARTAALRIGPCGSCTSASLSETGGEGASSFALLLDRRTATEKCPQSAAFWRPGAAGS